MTTDNRNKHSLSAIHDRAFDQGMITLDEDLRLVVGDGLREASGRNPTLKRCFMHYEGRKIATPERFDIDRDALEWHRGKVFGSEKQRLGR